MISGFVFSVSFSHATIPFAFHFVDKYHFFSIFLWGYSYHWVVPKTIDQRLYRTWVVVAFCFVTRRCALFLQPFSIHISYWHNFKWQYICMHAFMSTSHHTYTYEPPVKYWHSQFSSTLFLALHVRIESYALIQNPLCKYRFNLKWHSGFRFLHFYFNVFILYGTKREQYILIVCCMRTWINISWNRTYFCASFSYLCFVVFVFSSLFLSYWKIFIVPTIHLRRHKILNIIFHSN